MISYNLLSDVTRKRNRVPWRITPVSPEILSRWIPVQNRYTRNVTSVIPTKRKQSNNLRTTAKKNALMKARTGFIQFPVSTLAGRTENERELFSSTIPGTPIEKTNDLQEPVDVDRETKTIEDSVEVRVDKNDRLQVETKKTSMFSPSLTLQEIISANPGLPSQSLVLGVCSDGLPLVVDLLDSSPGSLLAIGDERNNQVNLLKSVISSIVIKNTPRMAQFLIFSHHADQWKSWISEHGYDKHCLDVIDANENSIVDWVLHLADWIEQRRLGLRNGPPILLVVDTLSFLPRLAYDIRKNFDWMVKEGPQAQIWTFAVISTDLLSSIGSRFISSFQTRIFGQAKNLNVYQKLSLLDNQQATEVDGSGKFLVQTGESWINFSLLSG